MSKNPRVSRVGTIYGFIRAHRHEFSVKMMCRVLDVAPSGYYDWLKQPVSNKVLQERAEAQVSVAGSGS